MTFDLRCWSHFRTDSNPPTNSFGLNIYDIIYHEKLLISKAAVAEIVALLDPKRESEKETEDAVEKVVAEKPKAKKTAVEGKPKESKEVKPKADGSRAAR